MNIFTASPATVDALWVHAKPHLDRFLKETQLISPDDILNQVRTGEKQLWMAEKDAECVGVVVTDVYEKVRGRICCIWGACGTVGIKELQPTFLKIESWARDIGCVALEVRGRKGWKRVLPEFEETGVLLEKDLRKVH